jgi:hypothetical protein
MADKGQRGVTDNSAPASYLHRKARKTGVSLHPAVAHMADIKAKQQGYKSRSAYLAGLVVYDMYCGQKHNVTSILMNGPADLQEQVFAELLANPNGKGSSWFKHRIEEIIAERTLKSPKLT